MTLMMAANIAVVSGVVACNFPAQDRMLTSK